MSNPIVHAFFIGRAVAEAIGEQAENAITNAFSELGKFDAEQRERLRVFTQQVLERAQREADQAMQDIGTPSATSSTVPPQDLQALIDDLRAEIAHLRTELQRYRSQT